MCTKCILKDKLMYVVIYSEFFSAKCQLIFIIVIDSIVYLLYSYNSLVRSAVTGKINESIEMFTCRDSLLAPLKPVTHFGADDVDETADNDNTKSSITALPTAPESTDKNAGGGAAKKSSVGSAASQQANHSQRLITFDSTDPEFDEDSDPDADLDL